MSRRIGLQQKRIVEETDRKQYRLLVLKFCTSTIPQQHVFPADTHHVVSVRHERTFSRFASTTSKQHVFLIRGTKRECMICGPNVFTNIEHQLKIIDVSQTRVFKVY